MFTYTFFGYWSDPLNAFDGVLVVLIIFEIAITSGSDSMSGNLRAARLFRFFRALRSLRILKLYRMLHVEKKDASTQTETGDAERSTYKRMTTHDMHDEDGAEVNISSRHLTGDGKVTPVGGADSGDRPHRDRRHSKQGIEMLNATPTEEELEEMEKEDTIRGTENGSGGSDDGSNDDDDDDDDGPIDLFDMGDTPLSKFIWAFKFPLQVSIRREMSY